MIKKKIVKNIDVYIFLFLILFGGASAYFMSLDFSEKDNIINNTLNYRSTFDIFMNNLYVFLLIIAGTLTLGVTSVFIIYLNVLNLGLFILFEAQKTNMIVALKYIVFHGLIELYAFYLGLSIVITLFKYVINRKSSKSTKIVRSIVMKFCIGIVLLGFAAFIEYLTNPA
ncbi:stage II sporulation protein M [Marinilactibacillus psychrotolerans]|uniref:Uncharacterized protein MJ0793 n=1 Tax=Marinilactibacillus psychrotolerans 42ea TaxID=1255609 RepID=A0A1R4K2C6_9LACT|nr:stage II sporulation protein M [Marinilactibacillus psychrotolerans]GEQ33508.1 hypothetical protein B795N_13900 [Marinilactibacillus psychrotolerans]SJN38477.1 Uncharacterized protein MJ0793 [Marinilactibacillus psychrotolerans 42ea]